jgi:EAL domain-containing protein (putative c-di-GMP-specific phosphodiesterase class I)
MNAPECRLLILDDDPDVGRTIERIALAAGAEARWTSTTPEFFDALAMWSPTHIALDLVMPGMDGVEVLGNLARRDCRARIIITSGVASRVLDAAGRSAVEHGLDIAGVLSKPFSAASLKSLLSKNEFKAARPQMRVGSNSESLARFVPQAEDLTSALVKRELDVYFQPKVNCAKGVLVGFEALVRWRHPLYGLIMPDRFVQLAEREGLIDAVTDRVLERALQWFAKNHRNDKWGDARMMSLSVNLSARTLRDHVFVDRLIESCSAHSIQPEQITLELTETSTMEDPVASLDLLTRLRMKGFQLSIDDFGTGYSSMLQLVRLPFSEIKVDKSFVITAATSAESRTVVRSVVELGRSLGLRTTAEGVETSEALGYLRDIGCDCAQGFLIGRPMSGEDILKWALPSKAMGDQPESRDGHP